MDAPSPELVDSIEKLTASGLANVIKQKVNLSFSNEDKLKIFGKTKGLHSTYDEVTRYDFNLTITQLDIRVETLTDFETGRSQRVDMSDIGPAKSSFTWVTISNLIQLHLGYYLPPNRMQNLLDLSIFSDVNIYRQLESQAIMFVPIYIQLGSELSETLHLQFDDTPAHVTEMKKMVKSDFKLETSKKNKEIIDLFEDEFGRFSQKANGDGLQKKINITCLVGRSEAIEPESEIYFYRTHYGHAGNLVEKILEQRTPRNKDIFLQGDLAVWNKPSKELSARFNTQFAGCLAHARRPFKQNSDDDDGLCDQMLKYFLMLTAMETRIDERGRTVKRTLYYRNRYGQNVWKKIRILARSVLNTKELKNCSGHYVWPPSSKLSIACKYIDKNFSELTLYLNHAFLPPTNNKVERLIRPEKLFINNSKTKGTEWARLCLDILRTIYMTCISAGVPFTEYMKFIYKNKDKIADNPGQFTPYAFAKKLKITDLSMRDTG